ncbi:hypothetical protein MGN70_000766 [Eutypa lata]|uniref:Deoxyribonuclease NucA/NucB domain-containing protein n=1 Tax=Eutypa lata (strain UCR-EL1) TaxID=1287681 RepID=M7SLS7_EUTLA|nr:hypothetical protein UCREL1_7694 [Eutypa lata UCREL1]KAI1257722.1 hypothetical protein MGN70_000766 [Eutypa lata]
MTSFLNIILLASALVVPSTLAQNVFNWDCTNSLMTCNNACYWTNCKQTGEVTLTYDPDNASTQRDNSGCSKNPCNDPNVPYNGESCDEFPFASVKEGGTGASLRCTPQSDQDSEGGQLSNFYANLDTGDQYTVTVENYAGARYCDDASDCTNDGEQFIYQNGAFVDNRRMRSRGITPRGFQPNQGTPNRSPFRKFRGEDGSERLWLSNDRAGTLVNQTVWSQTKGEVRIIEEIMD